jgi:hypothetical protein
VATARQALGLYARIWRTYFSWARTLLPLAVFVFVPLGLIHAIPVHLEATEPGFGSGVQITVALAAFLTLTATGLIGEVFYTGAVSIALTHPRPGGRPPSLREVARLISYGRLIAVDLAYGVMVAIGFVLIVPGILIYVYLGLAAPVIEIERHGVRAALARSFELVRGHFWLVFWVLVPIELIGNGLTDAITSLADHLLGNSLPAEWLADTASNIVLTPFYAVAAVLLTLDLIAARDGESPRLHTAPAAGEEGLGWHP